MISSAFIAKSRGRYSQRLARSAALITGLQWFCVERIVRCIGMKTKVNGHRRRIELGRHIVADSKICGGQPTFKGTRIMVWQVLDDVAEGRSWDFICNVRWEGRIPLAAVAEAIKLAERAWLKQHARPARRTARRGDELAAA